MPVVKELNTTRISIVHRLGGDTMAGSRSCEGRTDVLAFPLPLDTVGFTSSTSGSNLTIFVVAVFDLVAATPRLGLVLRVAVSRLAVTLGITSEAVEFCQGKRAALGDVGC